MTNGQRLSHRLNELFLNGKWICNTNYKEQLAEVSFTTACKTLPPLNSIAAITFHIDYYLQGLIEVFRGGELTIKDKYSFDAPNLDTAHDWQIRVAHLLQHTEEFAGFVEGMSDDELKAAFVKPAYGTVERNIEAVIEHGYYHLGQIILLRKQIEKDTAY